MRKFFITVLLSGCLTLPGSASPNSQSFRARMLTQDCQALGRVVVTYSPLGLRISMEPLSVVCVFKPPTWDAYVFSTKRKTYFETPREGFSSSNFLPMLRAFQAGRFSHLKVVTDERGAMQGIPIRHFSYRSKVHVDTAKNRSTAEMQKAKKEILSNGGYGWDIADTSIPSEIRSILQGFYLMPEPSLVPLKFDYVSASDKEVVWLDTKEWKYVDCNKSMFELPPNFKKVSRSEDILFPNSELKDLVDDMNASP